MARSSGETVSIGGHRLRLTNPDKVIYPATGTTKAEVIAYYVEIAPYILPHVVDRIATRKRWVDGVGTADKPGEVFFEKNLPDSAPSWIRRASIQHRAAATTTSSSTASPRSPGWARWRRSRCTCRSGRSAPRGAQLNPDRFVLDLDPGPGAGLPECVEVAKHAKKLLPTSASRRTRSPAAARASTSTPGSTAATTPTTSTGSPRSSPRCWRASCPTSSSAPRRRRCAAARCSSTGARTTPTRPRSRRTRCADATAADRRRAPHLARAQRPRPAAPHDATRCSPG